MAQTASDYDSPWKEALDFYFEPFMAFFFPQTYNDIDWSKGYESLAKELQEIVRDAETGRRFTDKLVKVWLRSGDEAFLFVHIEIQSQFQVDFAKRVYIYNHRLFDRYDREVISFVVLGDDRPDWRPTSYKYRRWDFHSRLKFPMVKLLDYQAQWQDLEQSNNPFAVIVMAHLQTQATRQDVRERFQSKLALVRGLYERGYSKKEVLELFRLLEWMMVLPKELEREFRTELRKIEGGNRMPYITGFERDGMVKNARQSIVVVLKTRFNTVPEELNKRLEGISDSDTLQTLLSQAVTTSSVEEFQQLLTQGTAVR